MLCDELESKEYNNGMTAYELMEANYLFNTAKKVREAIAELKDKVEELTGELRIERPMFKCAECGEVGPHKWAWNGKEGADFVARRCCNKCIKEKGLTLWPRIRTCEEKCKEFNALKAENAALKEERRWRKFPNEKPEWGKEVLVLADDGDIRRVRFSCDYKWISWGNMRTCESSCITHWMPQPKNPED